MYKLKVSKKFNTDSLRIYLTDKELGKRYIKKVLSEENINIDNIDKKTDQELKEMVSYQKESFIKNTWNKERTKEYFKCLLE